ncbi:hypothetical protein A5881_003966 [Enterococcus termitis]|nr:hypothetical protein A5881_003814 [Enterococcus termitis]
MKKLTKKQLGLIAAIALIGVGGSIIYTSSQNQVKAQQEQVDKQAEKFATLDKEVKALFDEKKPSFLSENTTKEKIEGLNQRYQTLSKEVDGSVDTKKVKADKYLKHSSACKNELDQAQLKMESQTAVNKLYQEKDKKGVLHGTTVVKDRAIADDVTEKSVMETKKVYGYEKPENDFEKAVNDLFKEAERQVGQQTKAKKAVEQVYKDNKVVSTDNKLYDTAKTETDKIKNEKAKKALNDQLDKVKADMDKQAAEDKAKADETAKAQTEAATNANTQENNTNSANQAASTNGTTQADNGYTGNDSGYVAPEVPTNGGYTPPASNGGSTTGGGGSPAPQAPSQPSTGGNADGSLTQEQGNKAAEEAANSDPTKDPNSPWFKP